MRNGTFPNEEDCKSTDLQRSASSRCVECNSTSQMRLNAHLPLLERANSSISGSKRLLVRALASLCCSLRCQAALLPALQRRQYIEKSIHALFLRSTSEIKLHLERCDVEMNLGLGLLLNPQNFSWDPTPPTPYVSNVCLSIIASVLI